MTQSRKIITLSLTGALIVGALPALAACSPQQLVQNAVENAVEDATGVDINVDTNTLPDGFPAEVPTISGEIIVSGSLGSGPDTIWTVSIKVADASAGYEEAKGKLVSAGFTADFESAVDGASTGMFSNGTYSAMITAANDGTNTAVTYVVNAAAAQ